MPAQQKYNREVLERDHDQRRSLGETQEEIAKNIVPGGMPVGTLRNILYQVRKKRGQKSLPQEPTMTEEAVEVHPDQMPLIQDADTPAEVHYGAVNEFDTPPDGYAKVIQPMREYTEAEDAALKESVRLFGFIGAIVRDQYGRILDGNQRSRVAHWFGKGCPFTITHVKDDEHAMEIANQLNLARRHFTPEQRQQIAASLREQGRSYRYIAEALHVSHTQARADVLEAKVNVETHFTPEPPITNTPVEIETSESVNTDEVETHFTPETGTTEPAVSPETPTPDKRKRIQGKDGKIYPDRQPKRSNGTKPTTSSADRQLAGVINLLMKHAHQWDDKHWEAFLEVVQTLRGGQDAPATT